MPSNVALSSNGGVATASDEAVNYDADGAINGNRTLTDWGSNGGWGTASVVTGGEHVLQVDFDATYVVDTIDVITYGNLHGNAEPVLNVTTFSTHGATAYSVEIWNGSSWVQKGIVSGNDKVWRQFTFAPVAASKARVRVTAAATDDIARIVEFQVFGDPPSPGSQFNALMVSP
jgi:hypothetical protein